MNQKLITWPGEIDIDTLNAYFQIKGIPQKNTFYLKKNMPRICSFYGIVIYIYWNDHNPPISMPSMMNMKF